MRVLGQDSRLSAAFPSSFSHLISCFAISLLSSRLLSLSLLFFPLAFNLGASRLQRHITYKLKLRLMNKAFIKNTSACYSRINLVFIFSLLFYVFSLIFFKLLRYVGSAHIRLFALMPFRSFSFSTSWTLCIYSFLQQMETFVFFLNESFFFFR